MKRTVFLVGSSLLALAGCTSGPPPDPSDRGPGGGPLAAELESGPGDFSPPRPPGKHIHRALPPPGLAPGPALGAWRGPTVDCVSVSLDGSRGLSSSGDKLTLWNLVTGAILRQYEPFPGRGLP